MQQIVTGSTSPCFNAGAVLIMLALMYHQPLRVIFCQELTALHAGAVLITWIHHL
jgi:hypothetical protein